MSSLTNAGTEVVARGLESSHDVSCSKLSIPLKDMYEIQRCVEWIKEGGYQKVCLQFPDELLGDAASVAHALMQELGRTVYILGDTTYGSCCVDEVAAQHVGADAVIHYGRSCLSPSRRLPVLLIFTRLPVDVTKVTEGIIAAVEDKSAPLILLYDTRCYYALDEVKGQLNKTFPNLVTSTLLLSQTTDKSVLVNQKTDCCSCSSDCCGSSSAENTEVKDKLPKATNVRTITKEGSGSEPIVGSKKPSISVPIEEIDVKALQCGKKCGGDASGDSQCNGLCGDEKSDSVDKDDKIKAKDNVGKNEEKNDSVDKAKDDKLKAKENVGKSLEDVCKDVENNKNASIDSSNIAVAKTFNATDSKDGTSSNVSVKDRTNVNDDKLSSKDKLITEESTESKKEEITDSKQRNTENTITFNGRSVTLPANSDMKDHKFVYIGPSSPSLTSLVMRFSEYTFYCVEAATGEVRETSGIKMVMARSGKLEIARDAQIIGILVGTLGVADYREVISRLKRIIKAAGKRSYVFAMGKPNEPKLANISEVDVFVYVACPETTIVEREVDPILYRKIITPWELEVALLENQEWGLRFESDFRTLLPGGGKHVGLKEGVWKEEASVSLITNKTQRMGVRDAPALDSESGAVLLQDGRTVATLHVGGGGEILMGRTWGGLDPSLPAPNPPGQVVQGLSGIASSYAHEK